MICSSIWLQLLSVVFHPKNRQVNSGSGESNPLPIFVLGDAVGHVGHHDHLVPFGGRIPTLVPRKTVSILFEEREVDLFMRLVGAHSVALEDLVTVVDDGNVVVGVGIAHF